MRLRYAKKDGTQMEFELGERPITIGRSSEADVTILDEKVSRLHCGIRLWDGEFFLKDLKSRNGTFVNGQKVDMVRLKPGDRIRVGSTSFQFEQEEPPQHSALKEMQQAMAEGKGYSTILQEIVEDITEPQAPPAPAPTPPPQAPSAPAAKAEPTKVVIKKSAPAKPEAPKGGPLKVVIRKQAQ